MALLLGTGLSFAIARPLHAADTSAPAKEQILPGKIVYAQLTTPDLDKAKAFYSALLGWTFKDIPVSKGRYTQAIVNGHPVAGLVERPNMIAHGDPLWLPFISVQDVKAAANAAKVWGGHILFKPQNVVGRGDESVISDPQGGLFAALRSATGDTPDDTTPPQQGEWVWNALLTSTPYEAAGFYQKLFGYQVEAAPDTKRGSSYLLESQSIPRATINPLPPRLPVGAHARWMNFVQVDNVGATAQKAAELGGKVLVQPRPDRQGTIIAIIADPAGAAFGVMEWHDAAATGDAK
ncbi:glyoxalase/bleomycin resistance protein/dioxygenase [Gluconobacter frateurii M-2]|nr:glyoxalase/bleomycin resistance protein/dioxygenase [Gluconobacter frateurii M-2]